MDAEDPVRRDDAFSVLRRFARRPVAGEQCELCSRAVAPEHVHLIEPAARRLLCVCEACAILFPGGHARYKRVPREIRYLRDFRLSDAQWDSLLIPIEMAFFYVSSHANRIVAVYPSPAGPTESLLPLETWNEVAAENPVIATLAPDVEALVVNRANRGNRLGIGRREGASDAEQPDYYILPIDQCYRLVGVIRQHWKGLSGGTEVWKELAVFFDEMKARARPPREVVRA